MSQASSTAGWQHIELCIDALVRIAPSRVLDVGVGHGRWAALIYESQDLWRSARQAQEGAVQIEGIALTDAGLTAVHRQFYQRLHIMPVSVAAQEIDGRFGAAIVEDVLEALPRDEGDRLLQRLLAMADYVIVVVRLGAPPSRVTPPMDAGAAPRGTWAVWDFETPSLRASHVFYDRDGWPHGVFILSDSDPRALADSPLVSSYRRIGRAEESLREEISAVRDDLAAARAELAAVVDSRAWRTWTRFRLGRPGQVAGWLYRGLRGRAVPAPPSRSWLEPSAQAAESMAPSTAAEVQADLGRLEPLAGESWLALHHPEWPGVSASTVELFEHAVPVREIVPEEAAAVAHVLLDTGVRRFVFSGFPSGWDELAMSLKRIDPKTRVCVLWHGSTTQMVIEPIGTATHELVQLSRHRIIDKIGFVKEGLSEVFARAGIPTAFVMNYMRQPIGERALPPADGREHVGLLLATVEWRKNNFTQLAAIAMLDDAVAYLLPSDPSLERLAGYLGLPYVVVSERRLPRSEAIAAMGRMHCNLNVTLSECCPMSVLESLSVGAPCLMSATSHLFRDHEYLHSRLCVPYHDNPVEIAASIRRALDERADIVKAYDAYIPTYNELAQESVRRFLAEE
jgi:hypothetical protein